MSKIKEKLKNYAIVGEITTEIAKVVEFKYSGKVFMAPGVKKHIVKRHSNELSNSVLQDIVGHIENIIANPEYAGSHPKKKGISMELVKMIGDNLLVAVEVDLTDEYIYVASLYPITESKLQNRINSGRFNKLDKK